MRKLVPIVLMFMFALNVQAKILRVNNTPGITAEYSTLEAAYTAAVDGDTIYVEGSSFDYLEWNETFTINKSLTILGPGYWLVENGIVANGGPIATMGNSTKIKVTKGNVTIKGLHIYTIEVTAPNVVISRCHIGTVNLTAVSNVVIHQNYITSTLTGGTNDYSTNISITNNIIYASNSITFFASSVISNNHLSLYRVANVTSTTFKDNLIYTEVANNFSPDATCSVDNTNYIKNWKLECLGGDTKFETDKDFQLLSTSELLTAGTNGGQIGAFGGNDPYVLSGIPNVPIIRSIDVPASASQADGLKVTVTVTTER